VSTWTDTVGLDPQQVVDQIVNQGVNKYDAAKLVNNLIAVNLNQAPRQFEFTEPLPTTDPPNCPPTFVRSFSHQDWVDGESVVQAGESADDKGFNWRFNALATDLDALHNDTENLYKCLVAIRMELASALQDVAAELNRIDADIAGAVVRLPPYNPWNVDVTDAPQFLGVRELDGSKVTMWKTPQGVMVLPGVSTIQLQDTTNQRLATGGLMSRFAGGSSAFVKDVAAGQSAQQLIGKYGSQPLGDGRTVAQALTILPPSSTYSNPAALVGAVNTAEQGYIRSTVGSLDAVNALTGVTSQGQPLTNVGTASIVGDMAGAPAGLAQGLTQAGIGTVGAMAGLTTAQLVQKLGRAGVSITQAQAAEMTARAQMIAGLGGSAVAAPAAANAAGVTKIGGQGALGAGGPSGAIGG
jgi:hypothetical protein